MRKKFAVFFLAAVLTGSSLCGSFPAEEAASSEAAAESSEGQAEEGAVKEGAAEEGAAETSAAEPQSESLTEGEESPAIPEVRPDYKASDYVKITDEDYKKITISVYPPVDDSEQAQTDYQTNVDTLIMTQLFSLYPVEEIPADLMNYTVGSLTSTYQQYAMMYGMDYATFLQTYLQKDETTFNAQIKKAAEQTLKEELLLKAVAEKENITVSDEEYEAGCAEYAVRYGYESADALKQAFDEPIIRVSLLMDKTFDYLESTVTINLIIETETESESENLTEAETAAPAGDAAAQTAAPAEEAAPAETAAPAESTAPADTTAPAEGTAPAETTAPAGSEAAADAG